MFISLILKTIVAMIAAFAIIAVIVAIPWLFFLGVAFGCLSIFTHWSN